MAEVVEGLDELLANFMRLVELAMGEPVTQTALVGGEVLREAMVQNAPGPGIVNQVVRVDPGFTQVGIGPDKEHWQYTFLEHGVQAHVITAKNKEAIFGSSMAHPAFSGEHPGIAARPFMRPAFDSSQGAVLDAMGKEFWRRIQEAIV